MCVTKSYAFLFLFFTKMKAVSKFKRHSRSLSQHSLNKMMDEVHKADSIKQLSSITTSSPTSEKRLKPSSSNSTASDKDDSDVERLKKGAEALNITCHE